MHEIKKAILEELKEGGEKSATELAKALIITANNANYHLNTLAAKGLVNRREISPRYVMWSLTKGLVEGFPKKDVAKSQ